MPRSIMKPSSREQGSSTTRGGREEGERRKPLTPMDKQVELGVSNLTLEIKKVLCQLAWNSRSWRLRKSRRCITRPCSKRSVNHQINIYIEWQYDLRS